MRAPKVIVCDVDSTLVIRHQNLTPRAKKAIECLRKHGVYFGIASGRPIEQCTPMIKEWNVDNDLIIAMNGNQLKDYVDDKEYGYFQMEPEWIKETIDLMKPFDCNPSVMINGIQTFAKEDDMMKMSRNNKALSGFVFDVCKSEDAHELWAQPNYKIMFRVNEKDMPAIEEYIAKYPSVNWHGFKTQPSMLEFANIHGSKGYALEQFCKLHDIDMQDAWAFGDTSNDNEMLQMAGVGVCMLNGTDDTKACANIITEYTCDDDGWARFVEDHILKPLGWYEQSPLENIKMVVCDIDNTLIPRHQNMSQKTVDVINTLRSHGIYFGVASGRPLEDLLPILDRWPIQNDIIIAMNGCVLYDATTKQTYTYQTMEPEDIKACIELMKPFENNPLISIDGQIYAGHYDDLVAMSEKFSGKKCLIADSIEKFYEKPNYKIMFRVKEEDMPAIEKYVSEHPSLTYRGFKTQPIMYEFVNAYASKAVAMKEFCKLHDIDVEDVWAFGDTSNDNELVMEAGRGVCLLNGSDDTKKCADYITEKTVDEDGFAYFVENHILKPLGWM